MTVFIEPVECRRDMSSTNPVTASGLSRSSRSLGCSAGTRLCPLRKASIDRNDACVRRHRRHRRRDVPQRTRDLASTQRGRVQLFMLQPATQMRQHVSVVLRRPRRETSAGQLLPERMNPPGQRVEAAAAASLLRVTGGNLAAARAVWGLAHGIVDLELANRFPPDADLDAWAHAIHAFAMYCNDHPPET